MAKKPLSLPAGKGPFTWIFVLIVIVLIAVVLLLLHFVVVAKTLIYYRTRLSVLDRFWLTLMVATFAFCRKQIS